MDCDNLKSILIFFGILLFVPGFSQTDIEVYHQYDAETQSYQFFVKNYTSNTHTVKIKFPALEGFRSDSGLPWIGTSEPGLTKAVTLYKLKSKQEAYFGFDFEYVKGCLERQKFEDYPYLLPAKNGAPIIVTQSTFDYNPTQYPERPLSVQFQYEAGDTIYASRRGVVSQIKNRFINVNLPQAFKPKGIFSLEIQHSDCSFGSYSFASNVEFLIDEHSFVEAGQPIAVFKAGSKVSNVLSLFVYRLNASHIYGDKDLHGLNHFSFDVPKFLLGESVELIETGKTYVVSHPTKVTGSLVNLKN